MARRALRERGFLGLLARSVEEAPHEGAAVLYPVLFLLQQILQLADELYSAAQRLAGPLQHVMHSANALRTQMHVARWRGGRSDYGPAVFWPHLMSGLALLSAPCVWLCVLRRVARIA